MIVLGVDPGISGALALVGDGGCIGAWKMPIEKRVVGKKNRSFVDEHALSALVSFIEGLLSGPGGRRLAVVEAVHARPGQGVTSMFGFGRSLGVVDGVLANAGFDLIHVPPATWTRDMGLWGAGKPGSIVGASNLTRARLKKSEDGIADAILLAEWGRKFGAGHQARGPVVLLTAPLRAGIEKYAMQSAAKEAA